MLHNNQFGPNEEPIINTNLTSEEMINPNNVNTSGKTRQQCPLPGNAELNFSEFPYNFNANSGMSQYPNFQSHGFVQNLMPQNAMQWQNNTIPINAQDSHLNVPERKLFSKESGLLNIPHIPQKFKIDTNINSYSQNNHDIYNIQHYKQVNTGYLDKDKHKSENKLDLNVNDSFNLNDNNVNKDLSFKSVDVNSIKRYFEKEQPVLNQGSNEVKEINDKVSSVANLSNEKNVKSFKDSDTRKRSLEKTLKMLEISILNSTNARKQNDLQDNLIAGDAVDSGGVCVNGNKKEVQETENLQKSHEPSTKLKSFNVEIEPTPIQEKSDGQNLITDSHSSSKDLDSTETEVKLNNVKTEFSERVTIKIEVAEMSSEMGSNPFQRDIFGLHSEGVYGCHIYDSENAVNIAKEMIKTGNTSNSYFECSYCNLFFNSPKRYLIHTKWHSFGLTSEKILELQREKGMKKQIKKETKSNRVPVKKQTDEKRDTPDGSLKCTVCQKVFGTYSSLKNHRQKFHPTRSRDCKICGKSVLGWIAMKHHLATHEEISYDCPDCPKKFKHAHSLAKHKDTHKEKTLPCTQCPKKFGSVTLLNIHMKTHERMLRGATFRCTYCGKGYFESFSLAAHERTHRNEKPFECEICNSKFGTNSSLKRHLKVSHNNTKPYECRTCHRCFMQETIRDRHELRVHGNPEDFQYPCKLCTSRYVSMKDLKKHMYKHHRKVKEKKNSDGEFSE